MRTEKRIIALGILLFCFVGLRWGAGAEGDLAERIGKWWDVVVSENEMWEPLIENMYGSSRAWGLGGEQDRKDWGKIRSGLVRALREHPKSPFAADIKVAIATMDGRVGKDIRKTEQMMSSIRRDYVNWPVLLSDVWIGLVRKCYRKRGKKYVLLPRDEVIRRIREQPDLRARFMCVQHFEKFPILASEVATLKLADIYVREGRLDDAVEILEKLLRRQQDVAGQVAKDKKSSLHPEGYYISRIKRPAAQAVHKLMEIHSTRGNIGEALATGETMGLKLSRDGWYHELINRPLADLYLRQHEKLEAGRQYQTALEGYKTSIARRCAFLKSADPNLSWENVKEKKIWEKKILGMKRSLRDCGKSSDTDTNELRQIKETYFDTNGDADVSKSEVAVEETLRAIHSRKGKFANPSERRVAVSEIARAVLAHKTRGVTREKEVLRKQRVLSAIGLIHLAASEPDSETRKMMIQKTSELVHVQETGKAKVAKIEDAQRREVDKLIAQIIGEEKVEQSVSYPETDLADMNGSSLLYAAQSVSKGNICLEAQRRITKALANSENPVLYEFFGGLVRDSEDAKLKRFAVRGLERIIENAKIDENGTILVRE